MQAKPTYKPWRNPRTGLVHFEYDQPGHVLCDWSTAGWEELKPGEEIPPYPCTACMGKIDKIKAAERETAKKAERARHMLAQPRTVFRSTRQNRRAFVHVVIDGEPLCRHVPHIPDVGPGVRPPLPEDQHEEGIYEKLPDVAICATCKKALAWLHHEAGDPVYSTKWDGPREAPRLRKLPLSYRDKCVLARHYLRKEPAQWVQMAEWQRGNALAPQGTSRLSDVPKLG